MKNKGRGSYLVRNTAIFTLGSLGTKLISFFLVPLYTDVLSTSEYGIVDLIATIGMVLGPVLLLNINDAVMRYSLDQDANHAKIMSIGLVSLIMGATGGLLVFPIGSGVFGQDGEFSACIYFYAISYAANLIFLGFLRGKEKLLQFSVANIINALLSAIFNIIFLVVFQWGIVGYFMAYTLANLVCCIYAVCVGGVSDAIKHFEIDRALWRSMMKYSVVLIPETFMWWIINSSDRVMITAFLDSSANGIFSVASKIPVMISTVVTIFNTAWFYSILKNDSTDNNEYDRNIYNGFVMLSVFVGAIMMIAIRPFMTIYVAAEYYEAWQYTPYLIVGSIFSALASFLGTYYTANKDSKGCLFSSSVAAISNIILNLIFIPWLGITGAAIATCISYLVMFIYRAFDTKRHVSIEVFSVRHWLSFLLLIIMSGAMFLSQVVSYIIMSVVMLLLMTIYGRTLKVYLVTIVKAIMSKIGIG